ncbi:AfsA-related hotdog domain-containing protein [Streptomyces buecherae]|uniref:AfsA-related hotdog domain-containing protein n=1 Tax=Streptomyces buecherae TaxID=2763006 RepID=UPI003662CFB9
MRSDAAASPGGPAAEGTTSHLIHRPRSSEHYFLDAPCTGEEHFVFVSRTPLGHPLFNDGPGHFHDIQGTAEMVRQVGEFIGHQFFGLPAEQHAVFARLHLRITHLAAWRARPEQADLTVRVRARPTEVVRGVPRGVELRSELSLDDVECATGTASLAFLPPDPPLRYAPPPRPAVPSPEEREDDDAYGAPQRPAAAAEVGRGSPANVVVSEPAEAAPYGRFVTQLLASTYHRVFAAEGGDHLSGMLLLEAMRQTALLAAGRTYGLTPSRATMATSRVLFRARAEPGLPLTCTAVPGPLGRDARQRPSVPVTVTLTQYGRRVAEATSTVLQDF